MILPEHLFAIFYDLLSDSYDGSECYPSDINAYIEEHYPLIPEPYDLDWEVTIHYMYEGPHRIGAELYLDYDSHISKLFYQYYPEEFL